MSIAEVEDVLVVVARRAPVSLVEAEFVFISHFLNSSLNARFSGQLKCMACAPHCFLLGPTRPLASCDHM